MSLLLIFERLWFELGLNISMKLLMNSASGATDSAKSRRDN